MNLTSKRMLQFMTAIAGACALTATATTYVSDSFEADEALGYGTGEVNKPGANYKMVVDGGSLQFTNFVWTATATDASKLIAGTSDITWTGKTRPLATGDANLVLNLETEGQILSRAVTNDTLTSCSFAGESDVFVDTLIKFTPSEDMPSIGTDIKVAVYVNASSNLVVFHRTDLIGGAGETNVHNVFTAPGIIDPAVWNRLTIKLSDDPGLGKSACKIWFNGEPLSNELTYEITPELDFLPNGPWFMVVSDGTTLSAVQFQGTGAVDELVVANDINPFTVSSAAILTLVFNDTQVSVTTNGAPAANFAQVDTGTAVAITAAQWYEVTDAGTLFTSTGATNMVGTMMTGLVGTVDGTNGGTNTIASQSWSDTGAVAAGTFVGTYSAKKIADWAILNSVASVTSGMEDDFLFNVAPATDATLKISAITVDAENATIVITTDKPASVTDLSGINGTLTYQTKDALTDAAWGTPVTVNVTGAGTSVSVPVPLANGKFMKASIQ